MEDAIDLYWKGDHKAAEELCKQALKANSREAKAYRLLGIIAHKYSKHDLAQQLLAKAIEINPEDIDAYVEFGIAMKHGSELDPSRAQKAIEIFEMAFKINPAEARPLMMIIAVLIEHCNLDEALNIADLALEVQPQSSDVHISRANVLKLLGRTPEALSEFKIALLCNANSALALAGIAEITKAKANPGEAQQLIKHIKQTLKTQLARSDEMSLNFALAKLYDELAEYKLAFRYLRTANDLKLKSIAYDPTMVDIKALNLINGFDINSFKQEADVSAYKDYPVPVFILGMPRSGSSLIEQILASHPDVYGAGEIYAFTVILGIQEDTTTSSLLECFSKFSMMNEAQLTELGLKYLSGLKKLATDAKYVTDKLPSNFWAVPIIRAILPQAIIVHSTRDPMDTCLSCYQQNFSSGHNYSFSLEGLGHFYNAYAAVMQLWQNNHGDKIYNLSYEDLIASQEQESRKLLEHCGLEWNEACKDFHKTKRSVLTASTLQVRQPIYRQSVAKWRNYESELKPLLDILKR